MIIVDTEDTDSHIASQFQPSSLEPTTELNVFQDSSVDEFTHVPATTSANSVNAANTTYHNENQDDDPAHHTMGYRDCDDTNSTVDRTIHHATAEDFHIAVRPAPLL